MIRTRTRARDPPTPVVLSSHSGRAAAAPGEALLMMEHVPQTARDLAPFTGSRLAPIKSSAWVTVYGGRT